MKKQPHVKAKANCIVSVIGPRAFPSTFDGTSGVEVYVEELIKNLEGEVAGAKFHIFVRKKYQQRVRQFGSSTMSQVTALPTFPGKIFEAVSYSFMSSLLSALNPGVSLVWYHTVGMAMWAWLPKLFGKKVWVTVHSADWNRKKWSLVERWVFARSTELTLHFVVQRCFFVSQRLMDMQFFSTIRSKTLTLPGVTRPPVRRSKNQRQMTEPFLLYLGRLVPEKRIEWLLKYAITQGLKVVVAGVHGNFPKYEEWLHTTYESSLIEWRGAVHGADKWRLLEEATLCVLPSELEGLPIISLEASAVGTPFFIRKDLLPKDLMNLSTVFVYEEDLYTSFSTTLTAVLKKIPKQKSSQSSVDRSILARYDWANTARVYRAAFVEDGCF